MRIPPGRLTTVNSDAKALANAINQGGNVNELLRQSILDAQLHSDWRGLASVENSLVNVDHRTLARRMQATGARGIVIQRSDDSVLAKHIPAEYEFGIGWMVCFLFLSTDGEIDTVEEVATSAWRKLSKARNSPISWGQFPLWSVPLSFGPPTRSGLTQAAFSSNDTTAHYLRYVDMARATYDTQNRASSNAPPPVAGVLWGCHVTGSTDLSELFDSGVWASGLDGAATSSAVLPLIGDAVGDSIATGIHIHPAAMAADSAMDFANWMSREQSILEFKEQSFRGDFTGARATVSVLTPVKPPYMDQISMGLWSKSGMLRQSFHMPRSGADLKDDAQHLAQLLHANGVNDVTRVDPRVQKEAESVLGNVIDFDGEWKTLEVAGLGPAASIVRKADWIQLDEAQSYKPGMEKLPPVLLLSQLGALAVLSDHYQPAYATAIKDALSTLGDPETKLLEVLHGSAQRDNQLVDDLLADDWALLMPPREVLLATQFKLAGGAIAVVSKALLEMLGHTDIGGDCNVELIRPAYDLMYLRIQQPLHAPDGELLLNIDGVLVQRLTAGGTTQLLLDSFLYEPSDGVHSLMPTVVLPCALEVHDGATLDDLFAQIEPDDEISKTALRTVAGVLLYMNSKDARVIPSSDRTEHAKALAAKSRKKIKPSDYEILNGLFDHIQIGPLENVVKESSQDGTGRTVKAHYRRGYVRVNQRYGPGRLMTRPVFIPPVLVNAKLLAGEDALPPKKIYSVK